MHNQIPKIIHYVWFGGSKLPKLVKECIKTWELVLPEYQLMRWDEDNTVLDCPYAMEAFKNKKWAFVSDYVRLQALYKYGGIYLDTDMLLIKSLDPLLNNEVFFGFEKENLISCGVIGCVAGNSFIESLINKYKQMLWNENNIIIMPDFVTTHYKDSSEYSVKIYPKEYFYAYPFEERYTTKNPLDFANEESYALHLWNMSWNTSFEFLYFKNGNYEKCLEEIKRKILSNPKRPISFYLRAINLTRKIIVAKLLKRTNL